MDLSDTDQSDPSRPAGARIEGDGSPERMLALERAIAERDSELAWTNERLIAELHERTAAQASALAAERYDPASGLPNRRLFEEQLARTAIEHQASSEPAAVLLIGVEQLATLRASMGFRAADHAARLIGDRLRLAVRGCDLVGRIGDGEFAVMLTHLRASADATPVARKLIELIDAPLRIEGREVRVSATMGVAACPADGTDADSLMQRALSALQFARETSARFYQFFDPVIAQREARRLQLQSDLRQALRANEFLVHYQPRVSVRTRRVIGVEALLRWLHPRFGLLPAGQFVDLAEESGLIVPIGEAMLAQSCAAAAAWPRELGLSVNLSAREFRGSDVNTVVGRTLEKTGLPPRRLQIEVTESSLGRQPPEIEATISRLERLRESGVSVALDQFGTGSCSLTLLRDFPADGLNIEGGFIRSLPDDAAAMAILRSITALGRHFGARVVAEGVENEDQFEMARRAGCSQAQGYLFGRPMPQAELIAYLERGSAR
ncbi:MAG TPA: bifunctional diguanylate cyclase/phosphodiesterase [Burkholderiaceae bacterium]|jgi:diguanylate cyclase (GGDEF)-like protein|nr:bifunctional diguanylate cyclase/phosphodiesterase [Burkholderiaceae bacterium]